MLYKGMRVGKLIPFLETKRLWVVGKMEELCSLGNKPSDIRKLTPRITVHTNRRRKSLRNGNYRS